MSLSPFELIDKKKRGGVHSPEDFDTLIQGVLTRSMEDYQLAAWLMAVWFRGLDTEETFLLTQRMRDSGECLDVSGVSGPTADKHSTGGVGDKVSLVLAPLAAELGLKVPMLSGRGLGHTGGTLDKLASIPGYRTDLSPSEMLSVLRAVGCTITGQTDAIAPADRKLYHLRDVTATVDCIPLIVSSILSKKLAAGPQHLVIDLKCGSGAFMQTQTEARSLAEALLATGRRAGLKMSVLITDMGQPLGEAVGHALEVAECLECLAGRGPADLRELTVRLVVEMAWLADLGQDDDLRRRAEAALDDGRALDRFHRMVEAHGGRLPRQSPQSALEVAPQTDVLVASADGFVQPMDARAIGWCVVDLGGGRRNQHASLDASVGMRVLVAVGDAVSKGQPLAYIHGRDARSTAVAKTRLQQAIVIAPEPVERVPLVLQTIR